jgi:orotate phosphoribosyltransferase
MYLIKLLKKEKIIKLGDFTLRSGIKSNYYCDIKEAFGNPITLKTIVNQLVKVVPGNVTCIAGSGYGGITLASLVSYKLKMPLVLVRDKVKDHGTKKVIDGYTPNNKDVVCIIDDVFTTGSSIKDTKDKLVITKVKFSKHVVVLNRSNSKEVISLISDSDILNK